MSEQKEPEVEAELESYNALIMKQTEKAILVEPINFAREESIWIAKSQFDVASLEIKPWMLEKLGFTETPLKLQLPDGGWLAVETKYARPEVVEEEDATKTKQEEVREELKGPGSGATVVDDNPANEELEDRDGEEHIMTLNEKLTQIKIEAIEDGLDEIVERKLAKSVKAFACIWKLIREDETFKKLTETQRGYAASAIYKKNRSETDELAPQDDDANVVKVYRIPNMGGGVPDAADDNEEGLEALPEAD